MKEKILPWQIPHQAPAIFSVSALLYWPNFHLRVSPGKKAPQNSKFAGENKRCQKVEEKIKQRSPSFSSFQKLNKGKLHFAHPPPQFTF